MNITPGTKTELVKRASGCAAHLLRDVCKKERRWCHPTAARALRAALRASEAIPEAALEPTGGGSRNASRLRDACARPTIQGQAETCLADLDGGQEPRKRPRRLHEHSRTRETRRPAVACRRHPYLPEQLSEVKVGILTLLPAFVCQESARGPTGATRNWPRAPKPAEANSGAMPRGVLSRPGADSAGQRRPVSPFLREQISCQQKRGALHAPEINMGAPVGALHSRYREY